MREVEDRDGGILNTTSFHGLRLANVVTDIWQRGDVGVFKCYCLVVSINADLSYGCHHRAEPAAHGSFIT